jgi:hypothetical protein
MKLKTPAGTNGYLSFGVYINRRRKNILVHRAVAMAWLGEPKEGEEVCHIDGDRAHNAVSNLRWDTRSGNHADKLKHGTHTRGERHGAAKLTSDQVEEIRRIFAARNHREWGAATLARKFGVSEGAIHDVARGKNWAWTIGRLNA